MLKVGFGRVDILPEGSVELGGFGNGPQRKSTNVLDMICATCIALTDETDKTVLLITTDLLHAMEGMVADARKAILEATGVPEDHIMIAATHSHTGPDIYNPGPQTVKDYIARYVQRLPEAAKRAMADRKPAVCSAGAKELWHMNFVRHYIANDGGVVGDNFGNGASGLSHHTHEPDRFMQLIRFQREGGKDVLLMNWQAHANLIGGKEISADYVGVARSLLELELDCCFAFFLGAAGDLNARTRIPEEYPLPPGHIPYGRALAKAAMELLENLTPLQSGPVCVSRRMVSCPVDHSTDDQAETARQLWDLFLSGTDPDRAWHWAEELDFHSPYTARTLQERARMPRSLELELNTVSSGDLAFVTAPYEMFCDSGADIKRNSPFGMTFVLSCCNGAYSYIPTKLAFSHGCYEVDTRKFAEGTAEMLVETFADMLKEAK